MICASHTEELSRQIGRNKDSIHIHSSPAVELPYVHHIVLVLQHSSFVIIYIKIIGCGEYCDERWKACRLAFSVHTVSGVLRLVGADDGEQIVVLQEFAAGCIAVVVVIGKTSKDKDGEKKLSH